ncbi:AMP-binding protein [Paracoccus sp. NBH48]|uniref:acyl-CoA synthetase n=1 Tax=Paracoccus sp. NBH48 TaxID=2596918 RepID=UPI0018914822|nr:acyl-CoA synthetase [Paracoccus sp. NBH48]MBF5078982.1 AMP-binding protein [Paracoccus sp. NBH48]|tara:strand:+ start:1612 stop:3192 length:1581 start_codon:yes stop_codon:yes gene_type:complete
MIPVSDRVMNLGHFLTQNARRLPDAPALIHGEDVTSWADMHARVGALAHALAKDYGVANGDRVLVQSVNCLQMLETMLACWRIGAVWVPANFRLSPGDLAWLAQSSGARAMFCGAQFPDHAAACAAHVPAIIPIGASPLGPDHDALIARHLGRMPPEAPVARDDPAWFFYTSGTTGHPKAAVLTHGQMAFVVTNHLCDLMPGTTEADASLALAPLSHGAGIHALTQIARGVPTILPTSERFDAAEMWALIERHRVTNMFTVPTILKLLVEDAAAARHDHSSLRYVIYAGAPMYRADQIRALEVLGPVLVQYFGLGEVTGNITVLPPAHHSADDAAMRIGTCGLARTGMQVQVQDAEGRELPFGETGEIAVIGPAVFAGYHDNQVANAKSFRDGWFLTGDLGHMDAKGFLYLTGRSSDMFISGGSNIHPREIEEKLLTHPDLSEAIVLGAPDPVWGEAGLAVCVPRAGADPDPQAVLDWLAPRLASYKRPKRLLIWDALPKSAYGKITRKMVRDELIARNQWPQATW